MKFKRIAIKNWMGLQDLSFSPDSFCVISGKNGRGKSSVIEAIRAVGEHVHDPARIRNGAEYAEVVIDLDNGYVLKMRTRPKSTTWTFTDNLGHEIKRSAEFITSIVNSISLDPVKFIEQKESEQIKTYISCMPLRLEASDLGFVPVRLLEGVDLDQHALEVIGDKSRGIYKAIYDERTFANRKAKEAKVYAEQLRKSLPEDAPEGDWSTIAEQKRAELGKLKADTGARVAAIRKDAQDATEAQRMLCHEKRKALKCELDETIEKRRKEFEEAVARLRADVDIEDTHLVETRDQAIAVIGKTMNAAMDSAKAEYNPQAEALSAEISKAATLADQHIKSQATRDLADNQEQVARDAEVEADRLTAALDKLEALKAAKISGSPIPGLEITSEGLVLNGVPFRIVNDAEKIRVAIELAKLRPGDCGVIMVDNAEHLDSENMAAFKEAALKSGLQFIAARVEDREFSIATDKAVNA